MFQCQREEGEVELDERAGRSAGPERARAWGGFVLLAGDAVGRFL